MTSRKWLPLLAVTAAIISARVEASPRAFVASTGNDANVATSCGPMTPCRGFAAAMTVVDAGGEIVALDAAGYGAVTITKSVSIIANPGAYAGIVTASPVGAAITIDTPSVNVLVRGLSLQTTLYNGYGIYMHQGASLTVENCTISGFQMGIAVDAQAAVKVSGSSIRDNHTGIFVSNATLDVSRSELLRNTNEGVWSKLMAPGGFVVVSISDSLLVGNGGAISVGGGAILSDDDGHSGTQKMSITRSTLSQNTTGVRASRLYSTATMTMTVTGSTVTGNQTGFLQEGGAVFESLGNNTVRQNDTNASGTITTVGTM